VSSNDLTKETKNDLDLTRVTVDDWMNTINHMNDNEFIHSVALVEQP